MTALINKFVAWLRSPYPELRQRWKTVVLPSLLVFFILYFLQPFGISRMEGNRLLVLSGYALVSMAMLAVVVYVFPVLFPAWHREERWTLGKELLATLLMCVLVTLGNWCYTAWTFQLDLDLRLLYICLLWMLLIGPFPIVLFMMWNRNLQLKRNLREAMEMNAGLPAKAGKKDGTDEAAGEQSVLVCLAGGVKETFTLDASCLLYAEADGNYVCLHYLDGAGKVAEKLLRITLKQAEESLAAYTYIIKCHRAFLVNLRHVVKVSGNAQGYRLQVGKCRVEVPVSRAYIRVVKDYFEDMRRGR